MKNNKLHTYTYTQLLQKIYTLILGIFLCLGCDVNPFDDIIDQHLEGIKTVEDDDFIIEFYLEKIEDINISSVTPIEFLDIAKIYYELTNVEALKQIALYIPHNQSTWEELMQEKENFTDYGAHTNDTQFGDYIILINPTYWKTLPKEDIIQIYVHELTHQVCLQLEGNSDRNHKLEKYWGNSGLMWEVINSVI